MTFGLSLFNSNPLPFLIIVFFSKKDFINESVGFSTTIASNYLFNNELHISLAIVNHIRSLILLTLYLQDGLYFFSKFSRSVPEMGL